MANRLFCNYNSTFHCIMISAQYQNIWNLINHPTVSNAHPIPIPGPIPCRSEMHIIARYGQQVAPFAFECDASCGSSSWWRWYLSLLWPALHIQGHVISPQCLILVSLAWNKQESDIYKRCMTTLHWILYRFVCSLIIGWIIQACHGK